MSAVEIITPRDREHWLTMRGADVTSTESAALFGLSPYLTAFELWHRKRTREVVNIEANERMRLGNYLEDGIARGIAAEQRWAVAPMKDYWRLPTERIGSSFDYVITSMDEPAHLEIKNVDFLAFRDGWLEHDDGAIEAPAHIEMQVQHQMMVSGFPRSYIGALVGGSRLQVIERERDEQVIVAMRHKIAEFWRTVDAGEEPAPVYPDDAEAMRRLHAHAEPGKLVDATQNADITALVFAFRDACAAEKRAKEDKDVALARLLEKIGDAEKVLVPGGSLSAGNVADSPGTLVTADMVGQFVGARKGYRRCVFYAKKGQAK
jgi:putative phage-type endonuclease